MQLVFSNQPTPLKITSSIFLAGPTPRSGSVLDWRKEAVEHLEKLNYQGIVFIPCPDFIWENPHIDHAWDYVAQVTWEKKHRHIADKIVFWVPRDISGGMPAFTTNIEFGEDLSSHKIVYGRPFTAEKCRYLDNRMEELHQPIFTDLAVMLTYVTNKLGEGQLRINAEIYIPLFIWETSQFQGWYQAQKKVGNQLFYAQVLNAYKIKDNVFSFSLAVSVFVASENRIKSNEILFSRTDISSVVAYHKDEYQKTHVIFVEEFRSCVNNSVGKVLDLPSGSNIGVVMSPSMTAQHEFFEETGLFIQEESRFKLCGSHQLAATFTTHKNHVFKIELNSEEFSQLKKFEEAKVVHGEDDDEITVVKILELSQIYNSHADLSTIGAVMLALNCQ